MLLYITTYTRLNHRYFKVPTVQYKFQAPLAKGRKIDTYSFFYKYAFFCFDLKHDEIARIYTGEDV